MSGQRRQDTDQRPGSTFVHAALIVDSDDGLRTRLIPVLSRRLDRQEPVLMVVSDPTERVVRAELGALSDELQWGQPGAFYQRLGFAFEGFRRYLAEQHTRGRRVQVVAEPDIATGIDPDSPVDRAAAYLSYESVCNQAYADYGCPVTCIWDSRRHSTLVIEGVRSLHSYEITDAGSTVNARYISTAEYLAGRNDVPLTAPPPATAVDLTLTDHGQLRQLRTAVRSWAGHQYFTTTAANDVVIAVTEVAVNGLVHGAAPVRVRAWPHAQTLIVHVDDAGGRPLPPTAGYLPPGLNQGSGRGLWLARQLADIVTAHTSGGITSVRLYFPYEVSHRNPPE